MTIEQVAKDFGVHAMMWQKWLQRVAIDDAAGPGQRWTESADLPEARKRISQLETEVEISHLVAKLLGEGSSGPKGFTRQSIASFGQATWPSCAADFWV